MQFVSQERTGMKYRELIIILTGVLAATLIGCTSQWKKDQAAIHSDLGMAYLNSAQYNDALKELLTSEDLYSGDPKVHYFLGVAYMGKDLRDKAITEFKKAIDLKDDFSQAHTYLGSVYNTIGLYDQAIDQFNKALANILYDAPAAALYNMGWSYYRKGDSKTALLKFDEAIAKDPNTPLLPGIERDIGIVSYNRGEYDNAVKHLKKSIELVPDFIDSYYWLGQCYLKQYKKSDAIAAFQTAIKLAPNSDYGIKAKESLKTINR
jgi:tetratricopeptide (TPR) repeat protein